MPVGVPKPQLTWEPGARSAVFMVTQTPSLNELNEMHWGRQEAMRSRYEIELLGNYDSASPWREWPSNLRRRVTFCRHSPGRLDPTNLAGGMKRLEDAMVNVGILDNDTDNHVSLDYDQRWMGKEDNPRTVVMVELLDEPVEVGR
jgi:hypothetical protein